MRNRWLVFNVGCIECGVPSNVVGIYSAKSDADAVAARLEDVLHWRNGGQNAYEVFDLAAPMADEYRDALAVSTQQNVP